MTFKTLTCAVVLAMAPLSALAMGCSSRGHEQTQSCAPGTQWDAASQSCVQVVNS
ncbi:MULTISPECIES: adenylosuccinate lyase [Ruegeria]|uniref:Adenylosuccinate lyase n=2 Tax=Ruegeria TaxID=97050 RepID=A0A6B2NZ09_9RHOB|nr:MULTISPECIES: adenylosuccinate lyase [unclassified Ruegeria]MCU9838049.1 adenylosuccinate lyase [Ruegeria sp. WL0004]NDW47654.1 adenylosuccinate lyase [Ruegeria sp. PrR005]